MQDAMRNRAAAEELCLLAMPSTSRIAEGMLFRLALLLFAAAILSACQSLEPETFMNTGKDARVFNPITGQYEWP